MLTMKQTSSWGVASPSGSITELLQAFLPQACTHAPNQMQGAQQTAQTHAVILLVWNHAVTADW